MPRKLKTYQTSQGFFDLAVAAPSMKAALEAWGARSNLFHQGFAKEIGDPQVIAATMAKPGVVLQRPVGTTEPFQEHARLPSPDMLDLPRRTEAPAKRKPQKTSNAQPVDDKSARKAARTDQKEQRRREKEWQKQQAAAAKQRERQQKAIAAAEAALERAQKEHESIASEIAADRARIEQRAQAEERRWQDVKDRLQAALRRASRS